MSVTDLLMSAGQQLAEGGGGPEFGISVEDHGKIALSGTGAWSEDSASVTIATGSVILVVWIVAYNAGGGTTNNTPTGTGLTFTGVDAAAYGSRRNMRVATAEAASGFSGALTFAGNGSGLTAQELNYAIIEMTGIDTGTYTDGLVQDISAQTSSDTSPTTVTLGGTPDTANVVVSAMGVEDSVDLTCTDATMLSLPNCEGGSNTRRLEMGYFEGPADAAVEWTWTTTPSTGIWAGEFDIA